MTKNIKNLPDKTTDGYTKLFCNNGFRKLSKCFVVKEKNCAYHILFVYLIKVQKFIKYI